MANKLKYQGVEDQIVSSSLHRQAIINGNFDVWQRGTSETLADLTTTYTADRWYDLPNKNGGTLPTLTRSRQALTPGDIDNAFYYSRLATNGAGSSLGASSIHSLTQKIEFGTRFLCGDGKKVTVSFWAKSDIADKKIGIFLFQNYGTGGSPTSTETIVGTNWTLTSTWTKYTHTFTTNTLASKTFGTANDDYLGLYISYMWGTGRADRVDAGTTAEDYVGSGNIDIAQVQLCAGDVALPFMPKSFEEELRACQRYYETIYPYSSSPASTLDTGSAWGIANANNRITVFAGGGFKVHKRNNAPTVTIYNYGGTANKVSNADNSDTIGTSVTQHRRDDKNIQRLQDSGTGFTAGNLYWFGWVAENEL